MPACESARELAFRMNVPWTSQEMTVSNVAEVGGYVGADLSDDDERSSIRFLFPDNRSCRAVITPEARVEYHNLRVLGTVTSPNGSCDPVGIASIREWIRAGYTNPRLAFQRERVSFQVTHRDEQVGFLRGQFLLAGAVLRLTGAYDVILMVPNAPECQSALAEGVSILEFRERGKRPPLALLNATQICPVRAVAVPRPPDGWPDEFDPEDTL
jgi:hypothetical protein